MIQLGPADLIDTAVLRTFPFDGAHPDDESHIHATWGRRLRELIFDPLLPHLAGRRRLLISPDGALQFVPFGLLQTDNGELLIEDYRIDYLSSGRDLLQYAVSPQGSTSPIVVADPDFDLTSTPGTVIAGGPFESSPGFGVEGKWLRWKLGAELWLQHDALKERIRRIRSPQILHFATHGFVKEPPQNKQDARGMIAVHRTALTDGDAYPVDNPLLRSGLALAGANTGLSGGAPAEGAEDGILTAEDVTALDLLGTELVVLSACDTGRGEVRTGEGVLGLRRAFTVAGARVLVMSLFQVPGALAFGLTREFYTRLLDDPDLSYAEALREAQLTVKRRYPDNPAWGFFICQGDPDLRRSAQPASSQTRTPSGPADARRPPSDDQAKERTFSG
jgi:CHAT domain-containing protein